MGGAAPSRFLCVHVFTREMSSLIVMPRHTLGLLLLLPKVGCRERIFCRQIASARYSSSSTLLPDSDQSTPFVKQMAGLSEHHRKRREKFLEAEKEWDAKIRWESLSQEDIVIVKNHKQAVMNGHFTYNDPQLNVKVMTRLRHFLRGTCCGNACRHVRFL